MPITTHLVYRAPRWIVAIRIACCIGAVLFATFGGLEGIYGGIAAMCAGENLEAYHEKNFWKHTAEYMMSGEVSRAIAQQFRDAG